MGQYSASQGHMTEATITEAERINITFTPAWGQMHRNVCSPQTGGLNPYHIQNEWKGGVGEVEVLAASHNEGQ